MAEILFYHLTHSPLEAALPELLERCLQRDWRVHVFCGTAERLGFLDQALWSYRDDSFLPHGLAGEEHAAQQPVLLAGSGDMVNTPDVLMLVDGAPTDVTQLRQVTRTCLIFDGNDPAAVEAARADWKAVVAAGLAAKYWSQESGRWEQRAESPAH